MGRQLGLVILFSSPIYSLHSRFANLPVNLSRSPAFLLNNKKYSEASDEEKKKMKEEVKSKATRNIILIRHGQYHLDSDTKNLTPLGTFQLEGNKLHYLANVWRSLE
ncbi:hypothetical protein Y032_0039g132 [Ancylostoma ceylanicum]|uniref:Phosphoglycerate mutase family protein n=1 Tax=Ancylostoma ceylanicum TaxID=53326 RepID=A0A016UHA8_9BILA|nr:hypothetical protein Y032_0039g132 [Ancylostoma ceylanicum]